MPHDAPIRITAIRLSARESKIIDVANSSDPQAQRILPSQRHALSLSQPPGLFLNQRVPAAAPTSANPDSTTISEAFLWSPTE